MPAPCLAKEIPDMLYLDKSQIKPKMDYCWHIWARGAQSLFFNRERVQVIWGSGDLISTLRPFTKPIHILSLLSWQMDEIHIFVPPTPTFTAKTRLATSTGLNHPHSLRIPSLRKALHLESLFPRTLTMWKRFLRGRFSEHYNLSLFISWVSSYLSSLSASCPLRIFSSYVHIKQNMNTSTWCND